MMTVWSERMIKALQLNSKSERIQESYVRTIRMLDKFYHKTPDAVTEKTPREYFLQRKNIRQTFSLPRCVSSGPRPG